MRKVDEARASQPHFVSPVVTTHADRLDAVSPVRSSLDSLGTLSILSIVVSQAQSASVTITIWFCPLDQSTSAPFSDPPPTTHCRAACIDLCGCVFEGERICTVMATAGIRYANVTQTHIRAPAHSWSRSGGKLSNWGLDR